MAELGSDIPMELIFEGMLEGSWRTAEARQCVVKLESMSGSPERTFCKPVKARPRLLWRSQGLGDARTMGSVPRSVVAWIGTNLVENILAESNRVARVKLPKPFETQLMLVSGPLILMTS